MHVWSKAASCIIPCCTRLLFAGLPTSKSYSSRFTWWSLRYSCRSSIACETPLQLAACYLPRLSVIPLIVFPPPLPLVSHVSLALLPIVLNTHTPLPIAASGRVSLLQRAEAARKATGSAHARVDELHFKKLRKCGENYAFRETSVCFWSAVLNRSVRQGCVCFVMMAGLSYQNLGASHIPVSSRHTFHTSRGRFLVSWTKLFPFHQACARLAKATRHAIMPTVGTRVYCVDNEGT